jgi:arylsulfatase A-like enzyme
MSAIFVALLRCVLVLHGALALAAQDRPNIVMIVPEGYSQRLHSFGDPVAQTPQLDALASSGVRYTNAFTTSPVCGPSRLTLLTGMQPLALGAQHFRPLYAPSGGYMPVPPPQVKGFPELLRARGYYTYITEEEDYQFSGPLSGGPFTLWDREGAERIEWRQRAAGQPFFAWINLGCTHESGTFAPLGQWPHSLFHFALQVSRKLQGCSSEGPIKPADVSVPPYYPDTPTVRTDLERVYNNLYQVDQQIGEILRRLQWDGLAENTIVLVLPDHGDGLPRAKRELYDAGIHLPLIVRWPEKFRPSNLAPGSVDKRLISYLDIAPSLLKMAGVDVPDYMHGGDLLTVDHQYVFAAKDRFDEVTTRQRAVRDIRFKYIRNWFPDQPDGYHLKFRDNQETMREMWRLLGEGKLNAVQRAWFEPVGREQLFDTLNDPYELHNLADDPNYASDLERLRAALSTWLAEVGDNSDIAEPQLAEKFWPRGRQPQTLPPRFESTAGRLALINATPGASIGYRLDGGSWQLYTQPLSVQPSSEVESKAVRYGWKESELVKQR